MTAVFNGSKLNRARHMRRLTIEYEKGLKEISEQDSIILSGFLQCNPDWLRG